MAVKWRLAGTYFEACNCEVACPCIFLNDPTHGNCTLVVAWHIDRGTFDSTSLDGLNAVLAVYSPGNMTKTKWEAALYIDARANDAQLGALQRILSGQEGGLFGAISPLIGKVVGVRQVPIDYLAEGKHRSLRIPKVVEASVAAIGGAGGAEVTISQPPLALAPTFTVAKSVSFWFRDHGWNWEFSGRNSFFAPVSYEGP